MSAAKLEVLRIESLRGSTRPFELRFDPRKRLTIVYGENGSGKTTICDALELLGDGAIGWLGSMGLGSGVHQYWPSVGASAADIVVELKTTTGSWRARVGGRQVRVSPPAGAPNVRILRRSQLLRLLEALPSKRYEELKRFIDVGGVEASEKALSDLLLSLERQQTDVNARLDEALHGLEADWQAAGNPHASAVAWARREVTEAATTSEAQLKALQRLHTAHQTLTTYPQRLLVAQDHLAKSQQELVGAEGEHRAAVRVAEDRADELVRLLEAAQPLLGTTPPPVACPLCESQERAAGLFEAVRERLDRLSSIRAGAERVSSATKAVEHERANLQRLRDDYASDAAALWALCTSGESQAAEELPKASPPTALEALTTWLDATQRLSEAWRERESALTGREEFLASLRGRLESHDKHLSLSQSLADLLPRAKAAHQLVVERRKLFTDEILNAVSEEAGRLYEIVHPDEGLGKIHLALDEAKRASLEVEATFGAQDGVPPQAYFSQSHLDTLGLCIFLALAKWEQPEETILVLDDVIGSVDEPHVDRLIGMVCAETDAFQHCLLTTHYRPCREKLRWGLLDVGECHFVELARWTPETGLQQIGGTPDVQRLKTLIEESPPDLQLVASKAGYVLEAVLDFLTQLYELKVPRKQEGRYTIGDLLNGIDGRISGLLRIEVVAGGSPEVEREIELGPVIANLRQIAQMRNVFGAHFNELSFQLLDSDALSFGQKVLELAEAIVDPEFGWPKKDRSGSYWETVGGGRRRLHPLRRPAS